MKVWLVTDGSYSDYHVEAVFADRAKAERFALIHHFNGVDDDDCRELDPEVPDLRPPWHIITDEEGNVRSRYFQITGEPVTAPLRGFDDYRGEHDAWWELDEYEVRSCKDRKRPRRVLLGQNIRAETPEEVVKIANERRSAIKAQIGRWPEPHEIAWSSAETAYGVHTPVAWKWPDWQWAVDLMAARARGNSTLQRVNTSDGVRYGYA